MGIETHDFSANAPFVDVLGEQVRTAQRLGEMKVRTSRGTLERYDVNNVINSLEREAGLSRNLATEIGLEVQRTLLDLNLNTLTGPLVRELAKTKLLERGLEDNAARYSRLGMPYYDVAQLVEHGSKENANLHHNPETIHKFAGDSVIREYLYSSMPRHIVDSHLRGEIHIHDSDYFMIRPNCMQHDLGWFFKNGLRVDGTGNHTSVSAPPKHAMVAALHAAKILASAQTNMAGGQSLDNFNIYMAPFMAGLSYNEAKQVAQAFVYEMNMQYVARGGQVVFSNMNVELAVPSYMASMPAVGPGGRIAGTYGDYDAELRVFTEALLDVFIEGDAVGKPHLFPSIVVKVRPSAFVREEQKYLLLKVCQLFAKYGTPYILNMCPEWQHEDVNSMGCRTRLSGDWADKQGYDSPLDATQRTGNLQYITMNLPRIALEANGDDLKFREILAERLGLVKECLTFKHDIIEKRLASGVLPFLNQKDPDGKPYYRFDDLTHTVGFVGLNEAAMIHCGTSLHDDDRSGYEFGRGVLKYMRSWADDLTEMTGWRWTLTQSPAESTAGRFARLDARDFKDAIVCGDRKTGAVYYTNSSHIAVDADVPMVQRAVMEGGYHKLCNGGHISHLFLGEGAPNPEGLLSLVEKLCKNSGMGLFDFTKDLTVCKACQTTVGGLTKACERCGSHEVEYYSRITGYCQRIGSLDDNKTGGWNTAKMQELRDRRRYKI